MASFVDYENFEFVRHDVCEPWSIECDRIYHLACPASPVQYGKNPVRTMKTAFLGTLHALECARDSNARLVVTSTSEIYGDPQVTPQVESYWGNVNPIGPRACYDEGKRAAEALVTSWHLQHRGDQRVARLFNTYGPRMAADDGRLIPNFILQAMRGEPMTIYGDGLQTRSFCYVSDTVDALIRLMDDDLHVRSHTSGSPVPIFNVGNPDERTVLSVSESIASAVGINHEVVHERAVRDDPRQRRPDISKISSQLEWLPQVSYDDGIRMTVDWFKKEYY